MLISYNAWERVLLVLSCCGVWYWQKVGDKHQLYNRKLRETPKAYSTAAMRMTHSAAGADNAHRMVITNRMTLVPPHNIITKGHNGQSAAKLPYVGRRFRDYNRMGASLRYSPLPLRKRCYKAIKKFAYFLGFYRSVACIQYTCIHQYPKRKCLVGRMVARASSRGNSSSNSVY